MDKILEIVGIWGIILVGFVLIIVAYLGSLLPALPGVPLAAIPIFLVHFTLPLEHKFSWFTLAMVIILTIAISVVDYILPIWGTKKYGGSKEGIRGSTIGLIVGAFISFFTGGLGMIALFAGPFIGAYIGEKYYAKVSNEIALKSAWGSLIGFLAGTIGKFAVVTIFLFIFLWGIFKYF